MAATAAGAVLLLYRRCGTPVCFIEIETEAEILFLPGMETPKAARRVRPTCKRLGTSSRMDHESSCSPRQKKEAVQWGGGSRWYPLRAQDLDNLRAAEPLAMPFAG